MAAGVLLPALSCLSRAEECQTTCGFIIIVIIIMVIHFVNGQSRLKFAKYSSVALCFFFHWSNKREFFPKSNVRIVKEENMRNEANLTCVQVMFPKLNFNRGVAAQPISSWTLYDQAQSVTAASGSVPQVVAVHPCLINSKDEEIPKTPLFLFAVATVVVS